jgi:hypothetical protein
MPGEELTDEDWLELYEYLLASQNSFASGRGVFRISRFTAIL